MGFPDLFYGWEKNLKGKSGPRFLDLSPHMDPTKLADSAAELNLSLMKWRLLPALNLDVIKGSKVSFSISISV